MILETKYQRTCVPRISSLQCSEESQSTSQTKKYYIKVLKVALKN